jgi:hypothetical protein
MTNVDNSTAYQFGVILTLSNSTCTMNTLVLAIALTLVNKFENSGFVGILDQAQVTLIGAQISNTLDFGNSVSCGIIGLLTNCQT